MNNLILAIVLVLAVCLGLKGCSSEPQPPTPAPPRIEFDLLDPTTPEGQWFLYTTIFS